MKFDSLSLDSSICSRSNNYYLDSREEKNKSNSKSINEQDINFNIKNFDAKLHSIFLKNLPVEKEVIELVSLYREIKDVLIKTSFSKNKKGVYFLHKEGEAYIRLINHIIDDYSTINNPTEIIRYASEALSLDFNDSLEIKKYLAFSYLSLSDFNSYLELKNKYPNSQIFRFTDCYYMILNNNYEDAYIHANSLKETNSWIANYILYDEYKNIISLYKSEKDVPNKIAQAVDFIICSFILPRKIIDKFLFFVSDKTIQNLKINQNEKRYISCFMYCSNFGKNIIDSQTLLRLNNEQPFPLYKWLINQKGSSLFSSFESLVKRGLIISNNGSYRFTYQGLRLIPYFKEKDLIKRLFQKE